MYLQAAEALWILPRLDWQTGRAGAVYKAAH
jgi:hypothetical protein